MKGRRCQVFTVTHFYRNRLKNGWMDPCRSYISIYRATAGAIGTVVLRKPLTFYPNQFLFQGGVVRSNKISFNCGCNRTCYYFIEKSLGKDYQWRYWKEECNKTTRNESSWNIENLNTIGFQLLLEEFFQQKTNWRNWNQRNQYD